MTLTIRKVEICINKYLLHLLNYKELLINVPTYIKVHTFQSVSAHILVYEYYRTPTNAVEKKPNIIST